MFRCVAVAFLAVFSAPAFAAEPAPGFYCNSAEKIEQVIDAIGQGVTPADAVSALDGCTNTERVALLVVSPQPVESTEDDGRFRYRATLIGMIVEGEVTTVMPPAAVYFFRDQPYDGASTGA
jgi:hypothetical protein